MADPIEAVSAAKASVESADIANILSSKGPVVKCVVLRTAQRKKPPPQKDGQQSEEPQATSDSDSVSKSKNKQMNTKEPDNHDATAEAENGATKTYPFPGLVEEIEIDTTPAKNQVSELLGGPFTFLGQYEEEGIVLMARRGWVEEAEYDKDQEQSEKHDPWRKNFEQLAVRELRSLCEEWEVSMEHMVEKQDLVTALKKKEQELPLINPHPLQPPFGGLRVRGDILVLKAAEVDEPLDQEDEDEREGKTQEDDTEKADNEPQDRKENKDVSVHVPTNEEFFLHYTKKEYLKFAVRTDVVPPEQPDPSDDDEGEVEDDHEVDEDEKILAGEHNDEQAEDDDDDDEEFRFADTEEMTEAEEKSAMLNIVMSELLRKFREENGRGPDTLELLEIRASVADQLGMEVATFDKTLHQADAKKTTGQEQDDNSTRKRKAHSDENGNHKDHEDTSGQFDRKRVKFDVNLVSEHHLNEDGEEIDVTTQEKVKNFFEESKEEFKEGIGEDSTEKIENTDDTFEERQSQEDDTK